MVTQIPERIIWAVDTLGIEADESIMEIGCGHGVAVSLICKRLVGGRLTAIDRSEKAVNIARELNRLAIEKGIATIDHAALDEVELGVAKFSKIFLFNLNVFWMDPANELRIIRDLLAPGGSFYIFHNPPPGADLKEYADAIGKNLDANGFAADKAIFNDETASLCIRSVSA